MELSLNITPVGDTTSREIASASQELREILERLPGVARIEPHRIPAPGRSKGAFVDVVGGFALSLAPTVLKALLQTVHAVLSRQPAPTEVLIETKVGKFNFKFDPKKVSLQELVEAAERLSAAAPSV